MQPELVQRTTREVDSRHLSGAIVVPHRLELGMTLGHNYQIIGLLGAGGTGEVYEAFDHALGRVVALKVGRDAVGRQAVLNEARAGACFRHPGLATMFAYVRDEAIEYLVMEHIEGVTLAQRIDQGPLPALRERVDILIALSETLTAIHDACMSHRDVKPDNIMLGRDGRVILLDLGLAGSEGSLRGHHTLSGTPGYLAPEAVRVEVAVGEEPLLDIYALGVTSFELLTGTRPFTDVAGTDLLEAHLSRPAPDPRGLAPELPRPLGQLVQRMLAKIPAERPRCASVVTARLRAIRDRLPESAPAAAP